jgi:hypothetical protein
MSWSQWCTLLAASGRSALLLASDWYQSNPAGTLCAALQWLCGDWTCISTLQHNTLCVMGSLGCQHHPFPPALFLSRRAEVSVDEDAFAKCEALMDRLLELDDVDSVYTNCEGLSS